MKFLIIIFLIFTKISFGQNDSYKLFSDSIFKIAGNQYILSKQTYLENKKKYNYDPNYIIEFLEYSLKNSDITFFKKEVIFLMKNYGFNYEYSDTLAQKTGDSFYQQILDFKLYDWLVIKSKKYYPKWLKKHPNAIEHQKTLTLLNTKDQCIRGYSGMIRKNCISILNKEYMDTNMYNNFNNSLDSIFYSFDKENINTIVNAYIKNNESLISNFDIIFFSNHVEFVIFHNMKGKVNLEYTWKKLHEYFEKAYIEGKISARFFRTYDYYLNMHYNLQYYGTLGQDIKIKDPETFNERKLKLNL